MNKELIITNEDIELLKEMKNNCLKADVFNDEKRLLKANAITKFLLLQQENQKLKEQLDKATRVAISEQRWASKCEDRCINYQFVLNEIREYINKFPCIHYASGEKVDGKRLSGKLIPTDDLLQILDKVKE